jgi:formylglycine-generating enzyme required for sulfatase activity
MIHIPAGAFVMGDGVSACGTSEHSVTLTRGFAISQHEVTNGEFLGYLQWAYDSGYVTATPQHVLDQMDGSQALLLDLANDIVEIQFDGAATFFLRESPNIDAQSAYPDGYDPGPHPVKHATWHGAASFCDWVSLRAGLPRAYNHATWQCNGGDPYGAAGYRLPTDAEWEYACRYPDERRFPWGDALPHCALANFYAPTGICVGWTTPPGSHADAPVALGLSHVAGNMWEWCNDWFTCDLGTQSVIDPVGPSGGTNRVCRAGGWASVDYDLACAFRAYTSPATHTHAHGFRIGRTEP